MVKRTIKIQQRKYNTIVIDPPWQQSITGKFKRRPRMNREGMPYKTMSLNEIKSFPIFDFANNGSHIYLWATQKFLRSAFDVFDSWNVRFHWMIIWIKPSGIATTGYQNCLQYCLLGIFGKPMQKFLKLGKINYVKAFNREHSRKPDEFYKLVEEMSPLPRIDIFSREKRDGFDQWGDEINKFEKHKEIKALENFVVNQTFALSHLKVSEELLKQTTVGRNLKKKM